MKRPSNLKCIMVVAGEASGDQHGAKLVQAMRDLEPNLFFFGIGGQALRNAGAKIFIESSSLSVVGITEVFSKLTALKQGIKKAKLALKELQPDLLILIDFPDFNLHLAAYAKALGIRVFYYISPQIWAWRSRRVKKIGRRVDHMAVILPFEEAFYKKNNIPVTFVGHPLVDDHFEDIQTYSDGEKSNTFTLGLLPGSRDREITQLLPIMLEATLLLQQRMGPFRVVVSVAPSVDMQTVMPFFKIHPQSKWVELSKAPVAAIIKDSNLVIAASGTVTLEAALFATPMLIVYKISPLSYFIGKALIHVKHIGLINLIAGEEVVPELIQDGANPENIAQTVHDLVNDRDQLRRMRERMIAVRDKLGRPGASRRAAQIALDMLRQD